MRLPIPDTKSTVSQEDLNYLASYASRTSGSGYRFVYARRPAPGERESTFRVRLKKSDDSQGRSVFEEYSGSWKTASDAARFVVSLLKDRHGETWRAAIAGGRQNAYLILRDPDEPWKYWVLVLLAGRKVPLNNHQTEDGSFSSPSHARWYVRRWAELRFPESGLSALGYTPIPADDRGARYDYVAEMDVPERFRVQQLNLIDSLVDV